MTPFPPPAPDDRQPAPADSPPSTGSRRSLAIAAFAVAALGVGGVVVGSQLVDAADDGTGGETETTDEATDDPTDETTMDDGDVPADVPPDDGDEPADPERPSFEDLDELSDIFDLEELGELGGLFDLGGIDLGELDTAFQEFDECLSTELPDLDEQVDDVFDGFDDVFRDVFGDLSERGDWDAALDELIGDSVTVFDADSDDLLTVFDFGEGDGSITITRTDGEIEVSTSGDVETIDDGLSFEIPDVEMPEFEPDPEFEDALEECRSLLPDGGLFDIVDDILGAE